MTKYLIGIDSGSTMCKAILFCENKILDSAICETSWDISGSAKTCFDMLISKHNIDCKDIKVCSTGYGRDAIKFSDESITEITCHGKGAFYLNDKINGVIDIGGQDSKIIKLKNGKVVNFLMNDKCAAGTGRFLEMACKKLEIPIDEIDSFIETDEFVTINSMCAVFAESEIIGLLANKIPREKILMGVIMSIACKINTMFNKILWSSSDIFLFTGGLAKSKILVKTIEKNIKHEVIATKESQLAGAIGAAISLQ